MNRLLLLNLPFGLLVGLAVSPAWAELINVPASADSIVHANSPDAVSSGTTELVATKFGTSGEVSTDLRFFYTQFQLPGGLTGQDIAAVNDVQLKLTRTIAANFRLNYYIYGVFDGVDSASADTYSWNSGVGHHPANNQVRFLTPDEISYYRDPAEATIVGNIRTANDEGPYAPPNELPISGPFDFTVEPQSPSAVANLKNLILNDTDGRLTFYAVARAPFEVHGSNTIASIEHETFAPPTLCIDFTRVPEPGTLLLSASGLIAVALGFQRKRSSR
jgi:PEP-CTERM motif